MSQAPQQSRGFRPIRKAASVFRMSGSTLIRLDPDGLRYIATILVWAHWFVIAFSLAQPAHWPRVGRRATPCMRRYCYCKGWEPAGAGFLRQFDRRSGVIQSGSGVASHQG